MLIDNINNKPRPRTGAVIGSRSLPRVSLNLHTMPQTSGGQFTKWLVLAFLIVGLMILVAILLFSKSPVQPLAPTPDVNQEQDLNQVPF